MPEQIDRLAAYRQAGVDLDISNVASQTAADWARTTWGNREGEFGEPVASGDDFSSAKRLVFDEIRRRPGVDGVFGVDGTGTKPELYERTRDFRGLGYDLVAMAADDVPAEGGQAIIINDGLAVSRLDEDTLPHIDQLFEGLASAANEAGLVVFTGEIAIHGDRLQGPTDFSVDWMADAMGLVHAERAITGADVEESDELWAFAQPDGFRCNGISRVRKTFLRAYGDNWHDEPFGDTTLGAAASAPSVVYSGLMTNLTGGYKLEVKPKVKIHGVAHVSGGSIPEKVGRMLRASGLGADIDDPFDPPEVMLHAQELTEVERDDGTTRQMTDEEMITTWHGGQGYIVAVKEHDGVALHDEAARAGIVAKRIGRVTRQPGIRISSRGLWTPGKVMEF